MGKKEFQHTAVCVYAQSCLTLANSMNCSLPDSFVHGIFQAGILEWVVISSPEDLPDPGIKPTFFSSPALAAGFFFLPLSHLGNPQHTVGGNVNWYVENSMEVPKKTKNKATI